MLLVSKSTTARRLVKNIPAILTLALGCVGGSVYAQSSMANSVNAQQETLLWKTSGSCCFSKYINGDQIVEILANQSTVAILPSHEMNKFVVRLGVWNKKRNTERMEIIPEQVHLFKITNKGMVEVGRIDAGKLAKSMERRTRIGEALVAGLSAAGSQTTSSGTATYSDGSTANYSVITPNPQAQTDAINRAGQGIANAQAKGAAIVESELKRNTLEPGEHIIGNVLFPKQKPGEDLLIEIVIGGVRYEFPILVETKTGKGIARDALPIEVAH